TVERAAYGHDGARRPLRAADRLQPEHRLPGDARGGLNLFREAVMGAWGAGLHWDGVDGVANPAANISNAPVELVEHPAPVLIERYALAPGAWLAVDMWN
ncbi:MAG: hypothetical protein RLZZ487_1963, partial [Pseudomonadota bacterium]